MKKSYIEPELELISITLLNDVLISSSEPKEEEDFEKPGWDDFDDF